MESKKGKRVSITPSAAEVLPFKKTENGTKGIWEMTSETLNSLLTSAEAEAVGAWLH